MLDEFNTSLIGLEQPARDAVPAAADGSTVSFSSTPQFSPDIYIGDRGYCSYNNMAHVIEKNQHFLFRSKDVLSRGILKNLGFPTEGAFDRTVRIQFPSGSYECLVTNLPRKEFPPERLAGLYFSRWKIECAYRDLKYTIGMAGFDSRKAVYVEQEVFARLLL